ncbi:F5/8 type C domain-containing protein [Kribbella pratensis]|uniref:F5/8 type C domain-containing protein n=1 Tax=Kribbella pratensis TaxID=2512112 RepID=A0ABY2FFP2_9ACTN|nr:discoidin domain-containing protein [Kribbella pratensis]TDW90194.1 F5/8 type C domain-containing protein [Kribbella pratensis]
MRIPKWRLPVALLAASLALAASPLLHPTKAGTASAAVLAGPDLAAGKVATASSSTQNYVASNVTDGNQGTYWESANNAFPQWIQVDLGTSVATNQVVLKLPTTNWGARDEILAVQGSTDGQNFTDLSASAARTFSPPNNTVTVDYGTATKRYVRIRITANTGWPAGQLSELEVYGPSTGDTQAPTAPGNLALTEPGAGQIKLTWSASTDNVGVTGYDVYANGQLRTSVAGNVLTYTDNQPANVSVAYTVRAKDAAGNQSANSNTVTRNGSGGPGSNLALHKPISASGSTFTYVPANANDDDVTTYWEGNANPATLTTELGANADLSSIVVRLNPDPAWGPRTQTFSILGREQGASNFTTIVASAGHDFNPASGNSVTIPVSARVADVRLNFTGNTRRTGRAGR